MDAPDSESSFGSEFSEDPQGAEEPHDSDIADRDIYDDARREHLGERRLRVQRLLGGHCLLANLLSEGKLGGVTTLRSLVRRARAAVAAALPADKDSYERAFYLSLLSLKLHQELPEELVTDAERQGMLEIQRDLLSKEGGNLADRVQHACQELERQWPTGDAAPETRSASRSARSRTGSHGSRSRRRSRRRSRSPRGSTAPASSEPTAEVKREIDAASAGEAGVAVPVERPHAKEQGSTPSSSDGGDDSSGSGGSADAAPPSRPPLPPPAAAPPAQPLDRFQIQLEVLDRWAKQTLTSLADGSLTGADTAQRDRDIATTVAELRRAAADAHARRPIEERQACERAEETARNQLGHHASHWVELACGELAQVNRGQGVTAELAVQRIVSLPTSVGDLELELAPQETQYLNALYETVKVDGAVDHDKTGALYSRLEDAFRAAHRILEAFTAKDGGRYASGHENLRKACDILGHAAKMRRGQGNEQIVAGRYHRVCEMLQELLEEVANPHNSMKAAGYLHRLQGEAFKLDYSGPRDKVRTYKRPPLSTRRAEEDSLETYLRTRPPAPKVWQPPMPSTHVHAGEEVLAKFAEGHPSAIQASGKHSPGRGRSEASQPPRQPVSFRLRPPGGGLGLDAPQVGHPPPKATAVPKPPPPPPHVDQEQRDSPHHPALARFPTMDPVQGAFSKSVPSSPWRRPTPQAPSPKPAPLPTAATWPHVGPVVARRDPTAPWAKMRDEKRKARSEKDALDRYAEALLTAPVLEPPAGAPSFSASAGPSKGPAPVPVPHGPPLKQGKAAALDAGSALAAAPPKPTAYKSRPPKVAAQSQAPSSPQPKHSPTAGKSPPPKETAQSSELPKSQPKHPFPKPLLLQHSSSAGAHAQGGGLPADPRERPPKRPSTIVIPAAGSSADARPLDPRVSEALRSAAEADHGSAVEADHAPAASEEDSDSTQAPSYGENHLVQILRDLLTGDPDGPTDVRPPPDLHSPIEFLDPTPPDWDAPLGS